jgi:UDP:flavonoid glycosyltransferase YjiC (YdhE family)
MRVLFSSTSGHGHVIPMRQLARALQDAGHDVLWATSARATPLLTGAGIQAVAAGANGAEEAALRGAVLARAQELPGDQRAPFVFPRMFGEALTPPMVRDLLPLARDWAPQLMIHEQAELAAPLVGALCGVPSVTHSFGTAVPEGILADTSERLAGLWREHGLDVPAYAGAFRDGKHDICPPSLQTVATDHIRGSRPLRPVVVSGPVAEPAERLVYVTLGTVHNRTELLGQVVDAVSALPVRVLVAAGPGFPLELLGEPPQHVQVESWVDQPAVLDRCTAVVSHGGSGTFLGAAARGLPQLCLPQAADQFRNAEGGIRTGAALVLRPLEVSPSSLRAALERLLADTGLRDAAQRVALEISDMPGPDEVAAGLAS